MGVIVGTIFLTSALLAAEQETLELRVFGMYCPSCSSGVESRVLGIPGVLETNIDIVKKKLFVRFDSELVNETKIIIALRQAGYEVRRPFAKWKVERVALEISGIRDRNDITEIERMLYAFYYVDQVEILEHSNNLITIIDFKKGGLDPGQLVWSLKGILPELDVKILPTWEIPKELDLRG